MTKTGTMKMIDISGKRSVARKAIATGEVFLRTTTLERIKKGQVRKGDVLGASQLAGILAVKSTSSLLPLCHPVPLTGIEVRFRIGRKSVTATCEVSAEYRTGVEMEALVGVVTSLLNIWDMVKYLEKDREGQYPGTRISNVRVKRKEKGGKERVGRSPGTGRGKA